MRVGPPPSPSKRSVPFFSIDIKSTHGQIIIKNSKMGHRRSAEESIWFSKKPNRLNAKHTQLTEKPIRFPEKPTRFPEKRKAYMVS